MAAPNRAHYSGWDDPSSYRFGDCRVDPSRRSVHHRDEQAVLSPRDFDGLAYLIEHRNRAVGRDELIAANWGKVDVSETLLGQTVVKARRAIGDTLSAGARFLKRMFPVPTLDYFSGVSVHFETRPLRSNSTRPPSLSGKYMTSLNTPASTLPGTPRIDLT